MNAPTMIAKGEQVKNQLIATALTQFGEYGLYATTRDTVAQVGQNIAAITYYSGSKEDLYLACARWIADFIGVQFRLCAEETERSFVQPESDHGAMCELILRVCKNTVTLLTQNDIVDLNKSISCEQFSPTATYQLTHDQVVNLLYIRLTRLIATYTGGDANNAQVILHIHAVLSKVPTFRLGKEVILLRTGWSQFDGDKTALTDQMITCHIDLILQGSTQRSLGS